MGVKEGNAAVLIRIRALKKTKTSLLIQNPILPMKNSKLIRALLPVSTLLLGTPIAITALHAQPLDSTVAEVKGDVAKAQLKEIDAQIDRLDELEDNAPTAEDRAAAKARIDALKERRNELRKNYVQARYDSLKADVKGEYNKLSSWTKKTFSSTGSNVDRKLDNMNDKAKDAAQDMASTARDVKNDALATANPAAVGASADIAAYRASPTDQNKADVKADLAALNDQIDRLDQNADALPRGEDRDAAKLRVKALKERRSELASDFRQARFDALKADVKAEWNKIVH
jgi:tetrahydromethanopterin S-methyltransferase subunit B